MYLRKLASIYSLLFVALAVIGLLWQFAPHSGAHVLTEEEGKQRAYELLTGSEGPETTVTPTNPSVYLLSQTILPTATPTPISGDQIGYSVAISGDYAVVGAPGVSNSSGAAYVFHRTGADWAYLQTLTVPSSPVNGDQYGRAVDVDGDTIIVGAPFRDVVTSNEGTAYIYTLSSGTFGNVVPLENGCDFSCTTPPHAENVGEAFGISVAVDGDTAVVGAYMDKVFNDGLSAREGSASKFTRSGGTWSASGSKTTGGERDSSFGLSVAVSGGLILVGAQTHSVTPGANQGQGAVYRYGGSLGLSWGGNPIPTPTPTPTYVGAGGSNFLGTSVGVFDGGSKDVAVMGATGAGTGGVAYVSESSAFTTLTALAPTPAPAGSDRVGNTVSIDKDMIAVGNLPNTGGAKVYVFRDNGSWGLQRIISRADTTSAYSLGVDENKVIVGDIGGTGSASIYVNTFPRVADRDADGATNFSVFRPSNNTWYILTSPPSTYTSDQYGSSGDKVVPADYDKDGKMDIAVFRPSDHTWYITYSNGGTAGTDWGTSTDIPIPADFDGDGKADLAVYRDGAMTNDDSHFYWLKSTTGNDSCQVGKHGDKPLIADFDGDGRAECAVFRPSNGTFYWYNPVTTQSSSAQWGTSGDIPLSGDFDGDLKTDLAVYRNSDHTFYIVNSSNGNSYGVAWGTTSDVPVVGDYDGDGESDVAVYRPSNGTWYYLASRDGSSSSQQFGASGGSDIPLPAAYNQ